MGFNSGFKGLTDNTVLLQLNITILVCHLCATVHFVHSHWKRDSMMLRHRPSLET